MRWLTLTLLAAAALAALIPAASASTIYSYSGNTATDHFGTTGCTGAACVVNGSFTLADPLGANLAFDQITPAAFSFTDGDVTIDNTNAEPGFARFFVETDALGNIREWAIELRIAPALDQEYILQTLNSTPLSVLCNGGCYMDALFAYDPTITGGAYNHFSPGTWSRVTTAPVPATLPLLLTAGAALFGTRVLPRSRR